MAIFSSSFLILSLFRCFVGCLLLPFFLSISVSKLFDSFGTRFSFRKEFAKSVRENTLFPMETVGVDILLVAPESCLTDPEVFLFSLFETELPVKSCTEGRCISPETRLAIKSWLEEILFVGDSVGLMLESKCCAIIFLYEESSFLSKSRRLLPSACPNLLVRKLFTSSSVTLGCVCIAVEAGSCLVGFADNWEGICKPTVLDGGTFKATSLLTAWILPLFSLAKSSKDATFLWVLCGDKDEIPFCSASLEGLIPS